MVHGVVHRYVTQRLDAWEARALPSAVKGLRGFFDSLRANFAMSSVLCELFCDACEVLLFICDVLW